VWYFGGEPLLAFPLLKKVTAHLRETAAAAGESADFAVCTNGLLLHDEAIAWFRENGFRLLVGFDGPPQIQDRNRPLAGGGPSSPVFEENARRAAEAMPTCSRLPPAESGWRRGPEEAQSEQREASWVWRAPTSTYAGRPPTATLPRSQARRT